LDHAFIPINFKGSLIPCIPLRCIQATIKKMLQLKNVARMQRSGIRGQLKNVARMKRSGIREPRGTRETRETKETKET
jgi:hypothetical protein